VALDIIPYPMALWSRDRSACIFNEPTRELLGFSEDDFRSNSFLWTDRIHPEDRTAVISAWQKLQGGEKKVSYKYRFFPKSQSNVLWLSEVAISYCGNGVWSLYSEERFEQEAPEAYPLRKLLRGLTHEIANNLQAISGELELSRWSGILSVESAETMARGITHIRTLAHEIEEYLFPPTHPPTSEDPSSVLTEVIQSREKEMAAHGIRTGMVLKEALPKVPLDWQFGRALRGVMDFSRALLPRGGELKIEAGMCRQQGENYIELNIVSSSSTSLEVEEKDVFRPFSKVNGYRVGLSMAVAQQILRRHFGEIVFRKVQSNRGVFSLLIRVPESKKNS
jgi:PAS fold